MTKSRFTSSGNGANTTYQPAMACCDAECSACLLFMHDTMSSTISRTHDVNDTYLLPVNGPRRLVDYSEYPSRRYNMANPSVPEKRPATVNSVPYPEQWQSFENSNLYYTRKENRQPECVPQRTYCNIRHKQGQFDDSGLGVPVHSRDSLDRPVFVEQDSALFSGDSHTYCSVSGEESSDYYETINLKDTKQCKKHLLHQFTEYCSKKFAARNKTAKPSDSAAPSGNKKKLKKRRRKRSDKEPKLFGPEDEERTQVSPPRGQHCVTKLLSELTTEIADLKCHGSDLTKQMWLLYSTFEEFLRARHPETAAGIKRYNVTNDEQTHDNGQYHHGNHARTRSMDQLDATGVWIDDVSRFYSSVAETCDWLRPEEECDEWSDDADRVRKLSESESESDAEQDTSVIRQDQNANDIVPQGEHSDCMNLSWYTKVKKIDKSGARHYRTRTPERKFKNSSFHPVAEESFEIETPVRHPQELFSEWATAHSHAQPKDSHPHHSTSRQGSPVTISSGYESDKEGTREQEIESMLYGVLPAQRKEKRKQETSPPYISMSARSAERKQYMYNMYKAQRQSADSFSAHRQERRSMEDISGMEDSDKTVVEEPISPGLSRSRSLDDVLRENGVVFINNQSSLSPNSKKGKRKLSELRRSMDYIIKDLDTPDKRKLEPMTAKRAVCFDEPAKELSGISMNVDHSGQHEDSDDDGDSCVYQNLPAALYAQVSPPKPETVYKTPSNIGSNPLWESTPLEASHKPRIMQSGGKNVQESQQSKSSMDMSLTSKIRKRIGFLLDEKSAIPTPYKSAFRPYVKTEETVEVPSHPAEVQHSIAELRCGVLNAPYLSMNQSLNLSTDQTPASVLVDDVTVESAQLDESQFTENDDTIIDNTKSVNKSPDSGCGSAGTPPNLAHKFPGFKNLKDSCLVHHGKMRKTPEQHTSHDDTLLSEIDPVYETIPSDIETTSRALNVSEHTYCKIGDIPTMLQESYTVPEPPPVRCAQQNMPLNDTDSNKYRILRSDEKVKANDIVNVDGFHTYTVSDILDSFQQYAGHLEAQAKSRSNIHELLANPEIRHQFTESLRGDEASSFASLQSTKYTNQKKDSKRSSKFNLSKVFSKNKKNSDEKEQSKKSRLSDLFKAPSGLPIRHGKQQSCDFTPGFSQQPPFETTGPMYTGGGAQLGKVKKTLSFHDMSQMSTPGQNTQCNRGRQSVPLPAEPIHQMSQYQYQQYARPHSSACDNYPIHHKRYASYDCTPTVIDGVQSYNTTTTADITQPSFSENPSPAQFIISPPSGFKDSSPEPEPEEGSPVYENIRDMELMRESRRRAVVEGRAFRVTPLRRTRSALQIQWQAPQESREIFC